MIINKILPIAFMLILSGALPAGAQTQNSKSRTAPAPKVPQAILMAEPEHHIGDVAANSTVEHIFKLDNEGEADLVIKSVYSGCKCSIVSFDANIAPGKSGEIKFKIHYEPEWAGKQIRRSVFIETNDPEQTSLNLTVLANVTAEVKKEN